MSLIGICGGPGTGKATLASRVHAKVGGVVVHTDEFKKLPWGDQPSAIIAVVRANPQVTIVEGVTVARAVRKGLVVDALIALMTTLVPINKGQQTMTRGLMTILQDVRHIPFVDIYQAEAYILEYLVDV